MSQPRSKTMLSGVEAFRKYKCFSKEKNKKCSPITFGGDITLNVLDTDQEIGITWGFTYIGSTVVEEVSTKKTIKAIGNTSKMSGKYIRKPCGVSH